MSDGQLLFITFAALYLIECLRLVPARASIAVGRGSCWRLIRPPQNLRGRGLGIILLPPLPPLPAHFHTTPWIFIPHDDHLEVRDHEQTTARIDWPQLAPSHDEAALILKGVMTLRLHSPAAARDWCARLVEWRDADAGRRRDLFLRDARQSLDTTAAEKTARTLQRRVSTLNNIAAAILLACFGGITIVYRWLGEGTQLWIALLVLLAMQITQSIVFLRASKASDLGPAVPWRRCKALVIALLPHMSARAADHLCRVITNTPHPLSLRAIMDDAAWKKLATTFWRDARFRPGWQTRDELPPDAIALQRFFREQDIDTAALESPPEKTGSSLAWCPRCHTQFERADITCADCGGVALQEW